MAAGEPAVGAAEGGIVSKRRSCNESLMGLIMPLLSWEEPTADELEENGCQCVTCHDLVSIPAGYGPTPLCNDCAQKFTMSVLEVWRQLGPRKP